MTAGRIVDAAGVDLFAFAEREDAAPILRDEARMKQETAERIVAVLRSPAVFNALAESLMRYGATFEEAEAVYADQGGQSAVFIQKHPYRMLDYGISMDVCDRAARAAGIHYLDPSRVRAVVRQVLKQTEDGGDSYIRFDDLCIRVYEDYGTYGKIAPLFVAAAVMEERLFHLAFEEGEVRVYPTCIYRAERVASVRIARGIRTAKRFPTEKIDIASIEEALSIRYADKQKESFSLLAKSGTAILVGGPGMGKTTLEKGYIMAFRQMFPESVISLCAPTAAAARRMREATGWKAETIHRLLEVRPTGRGDYTSKDEYSTLAADLVIADECSMIDTKLFAMLVRAMKPGSLLILVGDDGQLASVGSGCVLRDLMECRDIPTCRLDTYFRQDGRSTIAENGRRIRKGSTALQKDESFIVIRTDDARTALKEAVAAMERHYDKSDPLKCRLYTTARKRRFLCGTESINAILQEKFNNTHRPSIRRGQTLLKVDDPVVFTRNNYAEGYLNGDEGIIRAVGETASGMTSVTVDISGETLDVKGENINDIQLAYAMTVHKAQGAECGTAILLLPQEPSSLLERNLILVAATRAKDKDIIITEGDALERAIRSQRQLNRRTGLRLRLEEALGDGLPGK